MGIIKSEVSQLQINALTDLYETTNGDFWTQNDNWLTGDPCDNTWYGITCSGNDISEM